MHTVRRTLVIVIAALAAMSCLPMGAFAGPVQSTTGQTEQLGNYDTASSSRWGWDNTAPGVDGRPYIKYLRVTNGATTSTIVNDTAAIGNHFRPTLETVNGNLADIYAFVDGTNGCTTSQQPAPGVCYNPPNRVSISIKRWDAVNSQWTSDLTTAGATTNPQITTSSVIDVVIGFHSTYSSLRWSWVNGTPSYWSNTVVPGSDGTVQVKFSPRTMPDSTGMPDSCSTIPVSSCGNTSTRPNAEVLTPQIILSMDTTLDAAFTGVLFASSSAFIGSLESSPITAGQAPTLTYGVAAPHLDANGNDRSGTFYALVPNSILSLFGTSAAGFNADLLPITRTGDAGSYTPSWSEWTAGTNGTAGQLLTISNISFSSPKFVVGRQSSNSGNGGSGSGNSGTGNGANESRGNGNRITVGKTISLAAIAKGYSLKTSGSKLSAKVSTPKICKVVGKAIKGLKAGTCKGTLMVTPKKGKPSKKGFSFAVVGSKRLMFALHRR